MDCVVECSCIVKPLWADDDKIWQWPPAKTRQAASVGNNQVSLNSASKQWPTCRSYASRLPPWLTVPLRSMIQSAREQWPLGTIGGCRVRRRRLVLKVSGFGYDQPEIQPTGLGAFCLPIDEPLSLGAWILGSRVQSLFREGGASNKESTWKLLQPI